VAWDLPLPEHFEQAARFTRAADVEQSVHVSADLGEHAAWLAHQAGLGFERVMVHHVGKDQRRFLDAFGTHVLPELR
jgi:hypothetical protein